MSSNIKSTDNDLFTWGCNALFKSATYMVKTTKAVCQIGCETIKDLYITKSLAILATSCKGNIQRCPEMRPKHTFNDIVEEAENGRVQAVYSEIFLDLNDRAYGVAPKLKRIHVVTDPSMIQELFHARRGDQLLDSGFSKDLFPLIKTDTMILCPYPKHRSLRSPLEQTFSKRTMFHEKTVKALIQKAYDILSKALGNPDFIQHFVFFSITDQALGLELTDQEMAELGNLMTKAAAGGAVDQVEAQKQMRAFFTKILKEQHYTENSGMSALEESKMMTQSEKLSAAILMFAAGMHTTSNFIEFFLQELSRSGFGDKLHQEWNAFKEHKESSSSCQTDLLTLAAEFVQNSKLLHACYLEALRLYPIIPVIKRTAKKNFILGDTYIAAGDAVHLNIMAAHRDSRYWGENPGTFDPTRFLDEQKQTLFTFGLGSQSCIGRHLAEIESKVMALSFSNLLTPKYRNEEKSTLGLNTGFIYQPFSHISDSDYIMCNAGFNLGNS